MQKSFTYLIRSATCEQLPQNVAAQSLGEIKVKGRSESVSTYEVIGLAED